MKHVPYLSQSKLYEHLTVLKTVRRDLLLEPDIPDGCSGREDHCIEVGLSYSILFIGNESPPQKATMSENTIFKGNLKSL